MNSSDAPDCYGVRHLRGRVGPVRLVFGERRLVEGAGGEDDDGDRVHHRHDMDVPACMRAGVSAHSERKENS